MDSEKNTSKLLTAALLYSKLGFKIFPCMEGDKRPKKNCLWREEATTDRNQIERWWRENPNYNIGLPTGEENNLFVIDIDVKPGQVDGRKSLEDLERKHKARLRSEMIAITPSGGMHYFFLYSNGLKNSVKSLGESIDTRGSGGYVVAPPSRIGNGSYRFTSKLDGGSIKLNEVPQWILTELEERDKPVATPIARPIKLNVDRSLNRYAAAVFIGVLDDIRNSYPGNRNHALNKGAYRLGGLIATNYLNYNQVVRELSAAASEIGLDPVEAEKTILSGISAGLNHPYSPPSDSGCM